MKYTYLLITAFLAATSPTERTWNHLQKIFDADCTISYVLNFWVTAPNLTKFIQKCTDIIANYSAEIKIAIFQSVSECHGDEWRSSSNCGRIAAKTVRFNSVNSEITGRKFTKFVHDLARILPFNLLKADLQSANPLWNAEAMKKVVPDDLCDYPLNLIGCHSKVPWASAKRTLG